jgi:hypothetical protein
MIILKWIFVVSIATLFVVRALMFTALLPFQARPVHTD